MKKIIFCLPGNSFSNQFFNSWTNLLGSAVAKGFAVSISQASDSNVYDVRNKCLGAEFELGKHQKPWNGKIDYDYLMWIDSDMVFSFNQFMTLIEANEDVVSGVYRNVQGYYSCGTWDGGDPFQGKGGMPWGERELKEEQSKNDLSVVDYSGFGWMLVKKGVLESIEYPWFEPEVYEVDGKKGYFAEDVSWCRKVQKAGYQIKVNSKVVIGHEKTWILK